MQIERIDEDFFKVISDQKVYYVVFDKDGIFCTCRGYLFNGKCKHIDAIKQILTGRVEK